MLLTLMLSTVIVGGFIAKAEPPPGPDHGLAAGRYALSKGTDGAALPNLPTPVDWYARVEPTGLLLPAGAAASPGAVAYTLDPFNRTLLTGTSQPDYGGYDIQAALFDPATGYIYLGASGGDVLVMNGTTGLGVAKIATPGGVLSMALDTKSGELWTAGDPWIVSSINLSSRQVTHEFRVPNGARGIAYDSVDDRIYVTSSTNQTLSIIYPTTYNASTPPIALGFLPSALFYDPGGDRLFVGDNGGRLDVVNGATGTFESANWSVGHVPDAMALDPHHNWLYVANGGSDNVTVINLTSGKILVSGIPTGSFPTSVVYYPFDGSMLVGNLYSENVTEILTIGTTPGLNTTTITGGGGTLAFNPASSRLYTTEGAPGAFPATYLAVLDPTISTGLLGSIQLTFDLVASTFDPANGIIYLVNPTGQNGTGNPGHSSFYPPGNSSLMELNASSRQLLLASAQVGYGASAVAYDSSNSRL